MKPFEEQLDNLIDRFVLDAKNRADAVEEIVSALELKLMALKEERGQ